MRVPIGPVMSVPDDVCVEVGDGRAVVLRVGDTICAFRNRCVHQDSPLAGGIIRNGVLSCPLHFWRYHAASGQLVGARRSLERFAVDVVGDEAFVLLPDSPPPRSLRDQLLARARAYDRDAAWAAEHEFEGPGQAGASALPPAVARSTAASNDATGSFTIRYDAPPPT